MIWPTAPISKVSKVFGDGDWIESKDQSFDGIRLVQTGNVGEGNFKDRRDKARFISEATFDRLNCTEVLPGDVLISRLPDPVRRSILSANMSKPSGPLKNRANAVAPYIPALKDEVLRRVPITGLRDARREERVGWVVVSVILFDCAFLLNAQNWAGPIIIGILELSVIAIIARRMGVEEFYALFASVMQRFGGMLDKDN